MARLNVRARPLTSLTTLTTFGLNKASSSSIGSARVAMRASVWAARLAATWSITTGGINGSSPWTLTTIASGSRPSRLATSARRSVPDSWSSRVSSTSAPKAWQAATIRGSSVATTTRWTTRWALLLRACSQVCWIIGLPAISCSGLAGRRVEENRAGITTMNGVLICPGAHRCSGYAPRFPA